MGGFNTRPGGERRGPYGQGPSWKLTLTLESTAQRLEISNSGEKKYQTVEEIKKSIGERGSEHRGCCIFPVDACQEDEKERPLMRLLKKPK